MKEPLAIPPHTDIVTHMTITQDEMYLFSSDPTGKVICMYVPTWVYICAFSGPEDFKIDRLTVTLDSSMLMARSDEGQICFW